MSLNSSTLTHTEQAAAVAMSAVAKARQGAVANAPGYEAKGSALASLVIAEARGQAGAWGRYYRDLCGLEAVGRGAFKKAIAAHMRDMSAYVPGVGKERDPILLSTKRSAQTRLSEFTTVVRAMDAGLDADVTWPFHYAVGQAREFMRSQGAAANGRGRKSDSWEVKLAKYMEKNVPDNQWKKLPKIVESIVSAHEAPYADAAPF